MLKEKFHEKKGAALPQIIGWLLLTMFLILFFIELMSPIVHKQNVDYIAKQLAKMIEQEGQVTADVQDYLNDLNRSLNTSCTYRVTDVSYKNASRKTIQFMDGFNVVVTDTHEFILATPIGREPITYTIEIQSIAPGRSEVYWKD